MFFRRGDMPEPAPEPFRGLGPAPGYTVKRFPDVDALNAFLLANHVARNDAFEPGRHFMGGVVPSEKVVALLNDGYLRDPDREAAIGDHEYAHTWGLVHHDGGKGWLLNGKPVAEMSPAEIAAHIDAIRNPPPPPATYDWSKAGGMFAQPAPSAPPASPAPAGIFANRRSGD